MNTVETAKVPAWTLTEEYKKILARHEKADKGEIALLEVIPADLKRSFGGFGIIGKVKDDHKNLVLDTAIMEDRMWIPPAGAMFRFDKKEDLKWIYAILHCPLYREQCVFNGETPVKNRHRYVVTDAEKQSIDYAEKREEAIKYQNKFYSLEEDTINLLCNIAGASTKPSLGVKRADLCKIWENDSDKRNLIRKMVDSPDLEYHIIASWALTKGNANEQSGFYKTASGVYKHNEEIIGNSLDNLIAYLKNKDEVFFALKKAKNPEKQAVQKPK